MSARSAILKRVRQACGRNTTSELHAQSADQGNANASWSELLETFPEDVRQRLTVPQRHTQPDISTCSTEALSDALVAQMEAVQISVVRLQSRSDVVSAVDWYLQENNISGELCVAPALDALQWQEGTQFGPASAKTVTSVSNALVAVAETGSIALASSDQSPSTLNFLPENHVVVVHESQIVRSTEDVWDCLRQMDNLPRALNLVTGPSRTGDIEQTIELGAHGPRRMHVLLIAGSSSTND